jgi:hypothetical protein
LFYLSHVPGKEPYAMAPPSIAWLCILYAPFDGTFRRRRAFDQLVELFQPEKPAAGAAGRIDYRASA